MNIENACLVQDVEKTGAVSVAVQVAQAVEAAVEAASMDGGKMLRGVVVAVVEAAKHALAVVAWEPRIAVDAGAVAQPVFSWRASLHRQTRKVMYS